MPQAFNDAAFWITLTFATVIIWLALQAYWMRWAGGELAKQNKRIEDLEAKAKTTKDEIVEINKHNPYSWMKRAH